MNKIFSAIFNQLSGNFGDTVAKIAAIWKVPPQVVLENQTEVLKIQTDAAMKALDSQNAEIQAAAEVIKAEANSQSWIARNVRPLLLLVWGATISVVAITNTVFHFLYPSIAPIVLEPWIYKLTAIGFTGYVTARTWEKVTGSDTN